MPYAQYCRSHSDWLPSLDSNSSRQRYNLTSAMKVCVILPAAGLGTRMGREKAGTSRKQFMLLEGAPILVHTTRKFALCPSVSEIVVALRKEDLEWARGLVAHDR